MSPKPTYEELERRLAERIRADEQREQSLRRVEAENLRSMAILQQMPVGVVIAEAPSGRIIMQNDQVDKILQGPLVAEGIVDYGNYKGFHPDGRSYAAEEWPLARSILRGENVVREEVDFVFPDGSRGLIQVSSMPIFDHDGDVSAGAAVFYDVTERHRMEEAATQASHAKSEFLANMSHEIRTPVNAISGACELLLKTEVPEPAQQYAEIIRSSSAVLLQLIDDVLDFSKIEAGGLSLELVDFALREVVNQVSKILQSRASSKGIRLGFRVDPAMPHSLCGDPSRIHQVLINLVGNAIKFTSEGSVDVSVEPERHENELWWTRFSVRDSGIGIEPEAKVRLFSPFTQAETSTNRRFGGTGLGLAISKQLVELMGGSIGVESAPGVGSAFWFVIPLKAGGTPVKKPVEVATWMASERRPWQGCRILLAEDNAVNRMIARRQLESFGCVVDTARNGLEVLEAFEEGTHHLIFMDCQMPELDGYEATRRIRQRERGNRHISIIALTAHAAIDDRTRCLRAGMDDYLSKPYREVDLAAVLERWLTVPGSGVGARGALAAGASETSAPIDPATIEALLALGRKLDQDMLGEVAELFLDQKAPHLEQMRQATRQLESGTLERAAHRLKGSSANLGAVKLAKLCGELEMLARASAFTQCDNWLAKVEKEYDAVEGELRRILRGPRQ